MSKERARRRAEREAEAAAVAVRRDATQARAARSAQRRQAWLGWLPDRRPDRRRGPTGILAQRRRQQLAATLAVLVGANLLTFAFSPDGGLRALVLVASLLGAPVVHTLLSRRA